MDFVRRVEEMEVPSMPDHLAVSDLMLFKECPRKYYILRILNLPDAYLTGSQFVERSADSELRGAPLGEVVHTCLEHIDYVKDRQAEIKRVVGPLERPASDQSKVSDVLNRLLESELADEIRKAGAVLREVPLTLYVSDIPIRGRIDLLYRTQDKSWRYVDYKTNNITPGDVDDVAEHYRLQMELYGLTLSKMENIIPTDAVAYFLMPNEYRSFELTTDVLERCSRQVEEMIHRIKARDFGPADEKCCRSCEYHELYCRHLPHAK